MKKGEGKRADHQLRGDRRVREVEPSPPCREVDLHEHGRAAGNHERDFG